MKKVFIIFLCTFLFCGCETKAEYHKLMEEFDYVIVDVRTSEEYLEEHVKDAINIPYDILEDNINISKEKMIFVYCYSGGRSKIAYETLTKMGYKVYDLGAISKIDLPKITN
ncbi:MAG: rhodanese-like domain-containing protein [Bacilli bacterium]|nr:rhodanese-like domain-containing protein [Bacilli bacterium]